MKTTRAYGAATLLAAALYNVCVAAAIVPVHDVDGLYDAVNDAANAGAIIVLAPNEYRLYDNGIHGGRLELQPDMVLRGATEDPADAAIDARDLLMPGTGAIRTGWGSNALAWLTVRNAGGGASAITTDLGNATPSSISLHRVVVTNSPRGLDARNVAANANRVLHVSVTDSTFSGNLGDVGQGMRFLNTGASKARVHATLKRNRVHGNVIGCIASNLNASGASVTVDSFEDRFEDNGDGCVLLGGITAATAISAANDNELHFSAHGSAFRDNRRPPPAQAPLPGGIVTVGGQTVGAATSAARNLVRVRLWDVKMVNNNGPDINAFAAFAAVPAATPKDNRVIVEIYGSMGPRPGTSVTPASGTDANGNSVKVVR